MTLTSVVLPQLFGAPTLAAHSQVPQLLFYIYREQRYGQLHDLLLIIRSSGAAWFSGEKPGGRTSASVYNEHSSGTQNRKARCKQSSTMESFSLDGELGGLSDAWTTH
jgi:hypothetical protein